MLKGRLAFGDGAAAAPFPSAIAAWGADQGNKQFLSSAFPDAWHVKLSLPHSISVSVFRLGHIGTDIK
jgi:hypothetical protein